MTADVTTGLSAPAATVLLLADMREPVEEGPRLRSMIELGLGEEFDHLPRAVHPDLGLLPRPIEDEALHSIGRRVVAEPQRRGVVGVCEVIREEDATESEDHRSRKTH